MRLERIQNISDFKQLQPYWNKLLDQNDQDNPFLLFEWMNAWVENYADEYILYLLIGYSGDKPVGIAPLALNRKQELIFIGYPLNDFASFILDDKEDDFFDDVFQYLFDHKQDWKKIILDQIPENSRLLNYLNNPERIKKYPIHITPSDSCPEMKIDDPAKARKKYNKKHLNTYTNWFKAQGELNHTVHDTVESTLTAMESLFQIHINRRDKTPYPSHFTEEKHKRFYRTAIQALIPLGAVRLYHLTLDSTIDLSFFLAFQHKDILYLYTTGFNDNYARRSPGQITLRYIMDYALENNLKKIDFARGDENYKDRYTNSVKQNYLATIYSGKFKRQIRILYYAFKYSALINLLYRNKKVRPLKYVFLYHRRVSGTAVALIKTVEAMFSGKHIRE